MSRESRRPGVSSPRRVNASDRWRTVRALCYLQRFIVERAGYPNRRTYRQVARLIRMRRSLAGALRGLLHLRLLTWG
jgi:hypothetical protein